MAASHKRETTGAVVARGMNSGVAQVVSLTPGGKHTEKTTRHHRPFYDDYRTAKAHILQAIGDLNDIDLFGRQCLCAVFVRPNITPGGVALSVKEIREDWYQHKVVLLLKHGPDAFTGADSYLDAMYGGRPPHLLEWLFARADAGIQTNICGEGGSRPQGQDFHFEPCDLFEWDGWPCRIVPDDAFLGRLPRPHEII